MRKVMLQTPDLAGEIIDKGLKIDPYSGLAYGALVLVLGFICWRLYRDLKEERGASRELADQSMQLMTKLEERLPSVRQFADIDNRLTSIHDLIKTINDKRT